MDTTHEYRIGDVWRSYYWGTTFTVLDVGPHIGPDWFGGAGVIERGSDGITRTHCTALDPRDVLISREG